MGPDPFGRRDLFAGAGGLFLCTLAGQKVLTGEKADVEQLASEVPVPPKVAAAERAGQARRPPRPCSRRARPGRVASTGSRPSR